MVLAGRRGGIEFKMKPREMDDLHSDASISVRQARAHKVNADHFTSEEFHV